MPDRATARHLDLREILDLLAGGAAVPLGPGALSQLDHALQTASLLAAAVPGDDELAAAGLLHDIGHLMAGVDDAAHAAAGAAAIRPALGDRVAALVALHVEAKRFLVTTDPAYAERLASDSASSLVNQGGMLSPAEVVAFRAEPLAQAAAALRRADDRAKVAGTRVEGLGDWVPLLRKLSDGGSRAGG